MKMNKSKTSIILIVIAVFSNVMGLYFLPKSSLAQNETTIEEKSNSEEVKESLKKRLEGSVDEKLERVKGVLQDPNKLFAFVGQVEKTEANNLTITRNGQEKKVEINKDTELVLDRKTITAEEIETSLYAIAMGKVDDNDVLQAQRIVFSKESPVTKIERQVVFGKVAEVDNQKMTLKDHETLELVFEKKTQLVISGVDKPELADINVGDKAVAILGKNEKNEDELRALFIWPGAANPEAEANQINATESAETKTSPSP